MAVSKTGTGQWNAKGLGTEGWENKVTFSVCSFLLICADVELFMMWKWIHPSAVWIHVFWGPLGGLNFVSVTRCIDTTAETKAPFFPPLAAVSQESDF